MKKQFNLLLILTVVFTVISCAPKQNQQAPIIRKIKVSTPTKNSAISTRMFSGILQEASEINLAFRVAGPIEKIVVKQGDYVKKGQLIAQIDPRDYQVQVDVAQAQYMQMESEFDRLTELKKRESISENDYEKAVAGEKMLRSQFQHASDQLNDTKLYAPFSGYIQAVKYTKGELVNTGMTVATLIDVDSYSIDVDLPMSFFVNKEHFTTFTCYQPIVSDSVYQLQLIGYNAKANNNQLFTTKFRLPGTQKNNFLPGMNVEVSISYQTECDCPIHIPLTSVFNQNGKAYVWVYNEKNSTVNKQEVITNGLTKNGEVRIQTGISETDTIVVSGVNTLHDGEKVELIQAMSTTNIGGLL